LKNKKENTDSRRFKSNRKNIDEDNLNSLSLNDPKTKIRDESKKVLKKGKDKTGPASNDTERRPNMGMEQYSHYEEKIPEVYMYDEERQNDIVNHRKRKRPPASHEDNSLQMGDKYNSINSEGSEVLTARNKRGENDITRSTNPLYEASETEECKRDKKQRSRNTFSNEDAVNVRIVKESFSDGLDGNLSEKEHRKKTSEQLTLVGEALEKQLAEDSLKIEGNSQNISKQRNNYDSTDFIGLRRESSRSKVTKGPSHVDDDEDDDSYFQDLLQLRQKAASSVSNLNRSLMEVKYLDVNKKKQALLKNQHHTISVHRRNSIESIVNSIYDESSEEEDEQKRGIENSPDRTDALQQKHQRIASNVEEMFEDQSDED